MKFCNYLATVSNFLKYSPMVKEILFLINFFKLPSNSFQLLEVIANGQRNLFLINFFKLPSNSFQLLEVIANGQRNLFLINFFNLPGNSFQLLEVIAVHHGNLVNNEMATFLPLLQNLGAWRLGHTVWQVTFTWTNTWNRTCVMWCVMWCDMWCDAE